MLELDKIVFEVDTSSLKEAVVQVGKLGEVLSKVNKPMNEMSSKSKETSSSIDKVTQSNTKAVESSSKVEAQIKKEAIALSILRGEAIKLADETSTTLGKGFTKAQSSQLASLTMQGASKEELKTITEIISQRNKLMGTNPFDKSADGLEKLKQKSVELSQVTTLMNKGLSLSKTEIELLARDIESLTQKEARGLISKVELSASLQKLQSDYVRYSSEVAKSETIITQSEKDRKAQALANAEVQKALHQQEMLRKQAEIALAKQQEKGVYIAQGYSPQTSAVAANLKVSGVPEESIGAYLRQAKATEEANRQARAYAKAIEYLEVAENRLNARLAEGNQQLGTRYTDELTKYQRALATSGVSADIASKKMEVFKDKLEQVAGRERADQLRYLSRALSVQMGDVAISLASGMNPLIVMMQQGDQIRGAIQQVGASGKELQVAMSGAAVQIAKSFKDTGIAIGSFFVGAIKAPIVAVANIMGSVLEPVLSNIPRNFNNAKVAADALGASAGLKVFASGVLSAGMNVEQLKVGLMSLGKIGVVALITALVSLGVILKNVLSENSELNKQTAQTGKLFGLSYDSAISLSSSMKDLGVNTSDAVKGFTEISKHSSLMNADFATVISSSKAMSKYLGIDLKDAIKQFADVASKPSESLIELGINTGNYNKKIVDTIISLEKQGKKMEASKLAIEEYGKITKQMAMEAKENQNWAENLWDAIVDKVNLAIDRIKIMLNLRPETTDDKLTKLKKQKENAKGGLNAMYTANDPEIARLEKLKKFEDDMTAKWAEGDKLRAQQAAYEAQWDKVKLANLNEYEQRAKKINEIREQGNKAGATEAEINKLIGRELKSYNDTLSTQQASFAKFRESIAEYDAKQERSLKLRSPMRNLDKTELEAYNSMYDSMMDKAKSFTDARVDSVKQLEKARTGGASGEEIAKATEVVNQALIQEAEAYKLVDKEAEKAGRTARKVAEENLKWSTGAEKAINDYMDGLDDMAKSTQQLVSNAFQGMEDSMVNAFRGGKLSFSSMIDAMMADISRMVIRQALLKPLYQAMGLGNGGDLVSAGLNILGMYAGAGAFGGSSAGISTGTAGGYTGGGDYLNSGVSYPSTGGIKLATGTNYVPYDGFPATLHKGEAVVPAKYNPVAGGSSGSNITYSPTINIDSRTDQSDVRRLVVNAMQQAQLELVDKINRGQVKVRQ